MIKPLIMDLCLHRNNNNNRMGSNDTEDMITGWEKQKAILKEKFKKLTHADLNFAETRKNEMLGKLALKLGMTTRQITSIIAPPL